MANNEKLPWDMVEEILSRVHPTSLVRFQTVCKRWNTLFNDKTFINNHKKTFQFILTTRSKIYSVRVNPKVEVRDLTLDIPSLKSQMPKDLVDCNGFLLCNMGERAVVLNPCLRQTRCIKPEDDDQPYLKFLGIGYDNNNMRAEEIDYKTLSVYKKNDVGSLDTWKIHDFASDAWEEEECRTLPSRDDDITFNFYTRGVSLNGTLYFVADYDKTKTHPMWFILASFDFSRKKFLDFCDLPCGKNHDRDALVLRVFREDRFSLLKQCHVTKKIKIWVTKNKIDNNVYGTANVKWTNFMDVSIPNLPSLVQTKSYDQPSYFLDDKRLVICSCDETGRPWIYVMGQNKLITNIQLDSVVDPWPLHCTYFPSLVLIPGGQREICTQKKKKKKKEVKEKNQNYKFIILTFGWLFIYFCFLLVFS